ncbi:hypothetical protein NC653_029051 [Populus alba x Populus x berolinensis]|uniref:Uncharacterized protein n=1 Tax=Populus alba x Populus x berolinensis TaxID=444605 RepID=A0AAD6Q310_9ROSI|nr:hypothetical protein NC653_029051 [Populus alba x Populus x berolinensis]
MPTLGQRLGSFPTESMAEILPRCREDYPLPPPINRGFVDDLREVKLESKVRKKKKNQPSLPRFLQFLPLSLSPMLQPPNEATTSSTTGIHPNNKSAIPHA